MSLGVIEEAMEGYAPFFRTTMAQLFEVADGTIQKILLVFDTASFEKA